MFEDHFEHSLSVAGEPRDVLGFFTSILYTSKLQKCDVKHFAHESWF